jgi:hypothetical protein
MQGQMVVKMRHIRVGGETTTMVYAEKNLTEETVNYSEYRLSLSALVKAILIL